MPIRNLPPGFWKKKPKLLSIFSWRSSIYFMQKVWFFYCMHSEKKTFNLSQTSTPKHNFRYPKLWVKKNTMMYPKVWRWCVFWYQKLGFSQNTWSKKKEKKNNNFCISDSKSWAFFFTQKLVLFFKKNIFFWYFFEKRWGLKQKPNFFKLIISKTGFFQNPVNKNHIRFKKFDLTGFCEKNWVHNEMNHVYFCEIFEEIWFLFTNSRCCF